MYKYRNIYYIYRERESEREHIHTLFIPKILKIRTKIIVIFVCYTISFFLPYIFIHFPNFYNEQILLRKMKDLQ